MRLHAVKMRREIVRIRKVVTQQQVLVRMRIGREDLVNDIHTEDDVGMAVRLEDGIRKVVELGKHPPSAGYARQRRSSNPFKSF